MRNTVSLFLLALVCACFAQNSIFLPRINNADFKFDGVFKTERGEVPIRNGEFHLHTVNNKQLSFVESFDYEDDQHVSRHMKLIGTLDNKSSTFMLYLISMNNKCLSFEFSKAKGNFPHVNNWRQLGNKYERTLTDKISLVQLFGALRNLGASGGLDINKKHDLREIISIVLDKVHNLIKNGTVKLYVDDNLVLTKTINVNQNLPPASEAMFRVPDNCHNVDQATKQKIAEGLISFLRLRQGNAGNVTGGEQNSSQFDNQGMVSGNAGNVTGGDQTSSRAGKEGIVYGGDQSDPHGSGDQDQGVIDRMASRANQTVSHAVNETSKLGDKLRNS